jgi:hypothetical protein
VLSAGVTVAVRAKGGVAMGLAGLAICLIVASPALWLAWRIRRAELRVSSSAILVRNPWRTFRTPLDQVECFEPGDVTPRYKVVTAGIVIRLTSGKRLPVWALAEDTHFLNRRSKIASFAPLARDLNGLLVAARGEWRRGTRFDY